jgi:hypothetical protein
MNKKEQKIPKWFNGEIYKKGCVVANPYSGQEYELNNVEASIYDFLIGCQVLIEFEGGVLNPETVKLQKEMRKGLDWFRRNNAEAYLVLLD